MSEVISIQLEWKYKPENFLEEPVTISHKGVDIELKEGLAKAEIKPVVFNSYDNLIDELTNQIHNRLKSVQLISFKSYELSSPGRTDIKENGKKKYYLSGKVGNYIISGGSVDFVHRDKNGNIIRDTKKERLDKQDKYTELLNKYSDDETLSQMLTSFSNAVEDPDNELVHLFEIRDALIHKFDSKKETRRILSITKPHWNNFGNLANNLPLNQGRHRGSNVGQLRDATKEELNQARDLARMFIEKYLEYLNSQSDSA